MGLFTAAPIPLASDLNARKLSAISMRNETIRHWRSYHAKGYKFYLVTLIANRANTSDREPVVDMGFLSRRLRVVTKKLNAQGIGVIEVQAIMNHPRKGKGRTLMFNAHAIIWTDEPLDVKAVNDRFNAMRGWKAVLGANAFHMVEMSATEADAAEVSFYMTKVPSDVKNRMPKKTDPSRSIMMQTVKGYRNDLALRLFEGLSQIALTDTVIGMGAKAARCALDGNKHSLRPIAKASKMSRMRNCSTLPRRGRKFAGGVAKSIIARFVLSPARR